MSGEARPIPVYMIVVWSRGMGEIDKVYAALEGRFRILHEFDVRWRARDFVKNFAAFYGWKGWTMWVGKKRRAGTGPFRVMIVEDERPVFRVEKKPVRAELMFNENIYGVKVDLRGVMKHTNVVHASVNEAETRHNLKALTGETLEEFLAREGLGEGEVEEICFERPMPYVEYEYADEVGKGPRFIDGEVHLNRVAIFLLPRCGVPTIFSCSFRILSLFSFAFCLGTVKMGFRQNIQ